MPDRDQRATLVSRSFTSKESQQPSGCFPTRSCCSGSGVRGTPVASGPFAPS